MGVDFSHCDASWAYSGFNRARTRLAATIGLDLDSMVGFGGTVPWPSTRKSPLVYLLHHSDCDGHITAAQCRRVAPAIRQAVANWPEDDYDRKKFLQLADGMDSAASANQRLRFM